MTAITVTLDDTRLKRAPAELQHTLGDMSPVMDPIGHDLQEEIHRQGLNHGFSCSHSEPASAA